ncbi:MAG: threonine synthase [Sphingosinicella sp.]
MRSVTANDNLTTERPTFVTHLECSATGEHYEADHLHNLSGAGKPLLVRYDLEGAARHLSREAIAQRPADLWRWRELLPVRKCEHIVSLGEPATPLVPLEAVGRAEGARAPLVKDEGGLPTGSFKARGMAMAMSMAKAFGVEAVALPTNGNAGAAAAAYAMRAGIDCTVFCPDVTPETNLREIAALGARVYRVNGLIDDCGRLLAEGKSERGWFDLSTLKEPYRLEGKKVMGFELAEQLGWRLPDAIFYPTGGGTALIGVWKAFAELEAIGLIGSERPRLFAVQASGCAPIVRAFELGQDHAERWPDAHTIAAGIRVPQAIGDFLVLDALRASHGAALAVSDEAIMDALDSVARKDGLLLCPEGAATVVAWQEALKQGLVSADDEAVLFNCATGLKYPLPDRSRPLDRHAPIDWSAI